MIFTFTKQPLMYLLDHHFELFLGVQKLVAIFHDTESRSLQAVVKSENQKNKLNISGFTDELEKLRLSQGIHTWFDESSLPFRVRQAGMYQRDLFNELEKTVLLLRIHNEMDNKNDLLFIYFDKHLSKLGLSLGKDIKLSGSVKSFIANTLQRTVASVLNDAYDNQKILKTNFNPGTQTIIQSHKQLIIDYTNLQSQFNNTFLKLVKSIFYKYLDSSKYSITLGDAAIRKLIQFNGDFDELERVIRNTVSYLSTLYLGDLPEIIDVQEYFINTKLSNKNTSETEDNNRYTKTIHLLDNLNGAVKEVMSKQLNPTGALVGKAMQKPVSAPAITDALKNHRKKILTLLEQYPNRWIELRQYFKPIQNIRLYWDKQNRMSV